MRQKNLLLVGIVLLVGSMVVGCGGSTDDDVLEASAHFTGSYIEQGGLERQDGTMMPVGDVTVRMSDDEDRRELLLRFDQDSVFVIDGHEVGSYEFYLACFPDPLTGEQPALVEMTIDTSRAPTNAFYGAIITAGN